MIRLLLWLTAHLPVRLIQEDGRPYLERYFVFQLFGVRCYIHRFVGSDPERGLHDHPWRWAASLVLAGWYLEERRDGTRRRRIGNLLSADTFHRVVIPEGQTECWTLFLHSARDVKSWGFLSAEPGGMKGMHVWSPYAYVREGGKPNRWELTAPKGREIRTH